MVRVILILNYSCLQILNVLLIHIHRECHYQCLKCRYHVRVNKKFNQYHVHTKYPAIESTSQTKVTNFTNPNLDTIQRSKTYIQNLKMFFIKQAKISRTKSFSSILFKFIFNIIFLYGQLFYQMQSMGPQEICSFIIVSLCNIDAQLNQTDLFFSGVIVYYFWF